MHATVFSFDCKRDIQLFTEKQIGYAGTQNLTIKESASRFRERNAHVLVLIRFSFSYVI